MSNLATCPLTIYVLHPHSNSPVRAEKCQAVVYRDRKGQWYVRPLTVRNVIIRVHLVKGKSEFECRLHARNFLLAFFPEQKA